MDEDEQKGYGPSPRKKISSHGQPMILSMISFMSAGLVCRSLAIDILISFAIHLLQGGGQMPWRTIGANLRAFSPSLSHSCRGLLLLRHLIKPSTKTSFWSWASAAAVCALQFKSSITLPDTRRERLASTMQRRKNILQCESLTRTVGC